MSSFKQMASFPDTKTSKNSKEIQVLIILLIAEIRGLKELNNTDGEFDD